MVFSIILPVYNVERYIAKCIRSILDQTFTDFELLVIIDGSPDNSKTVAESFDDDRIIIYEKENGGLSDARNYGLERAIGEYVYFVDSDDWIEPTLLCSCLDILEKENTDIVIFGYIQENENSQGNIVSSIEVLPVVGSLKKTSQPSMLDIRLMGLLGYAWNKVYKKKLLTEKGIKFERGVSLVEDVLFNSEVYQNTDKIFFIAKAFYHYSNRPVTTLIKQFHVNSFELILKKDTSLKLFLSVWNIQNRNQILTSVLVEGIKYAVHNIFSFGNNLSFKEKKEYIKTILLSNIVKDSIAYYKPISNRDKIYKQLIKYKNYRLLSLLASWIK